MKANLLTLVITLTVGIILAGSLLMPVINDNTDTTKTYTNLGMPYAEAVSGETHTITVTSSEITSDGETIDQTLFPGEFGHYTLVYGSDGFVRFDVNTNVKVINISGRYNLSLANDATITVSISGTGATISTTASESTYSLTDVEYFISTTGPMVLAVNPVVLNDSDIIGEGETEFSTSIGIPDPLDVALYWEGTTEGITGTVIQYANGDNWNKPTIKESVINTTEQAGGCLKIDSVVITYSATNRDNSEYNPASTYTYFLAPKEITYNNPNYIGDGNAAIMEAIPYLIIAALVVMAAGALYLKRDD